MHVERIRRYPVKAMAGEPLDAVGLDARGLAGDRWHAVVDTDGRFAAGKDTRRFRRRDAVFDYGATTDAAGGVEVTGARGRWRVGDDGLDAELGESMGVPVRVRPEAAVPHQDMGAVSLVGTATLAWWEDRWGVDADPRRLRVNLVVATAEPFVEDTWVGRTVDVGAARLAVVARAPRCRVVDLAQDGAEAVQRWLRPIASERELCLAVYADVARPATVRVGDEVAVRGEAAPGA